MHNPFAEVERRYHELVQAYQRGELGSDQFEEQLSALQLQDEQQSWWQIQGNGEWLRFDAQKECWQPATPPRPAPPPPPRSALAPPPRREAGSERVEEPDDSVFYATFQPEHQLPERAGLIDLLETGREAVDPPKPADPSRCAACGQTLLPGARFCGYCGQAALARPFLAPT